MAKFNIRMETALLKQLMERSIEGVEEGAKAGLADVKDEWVADAVDIAPLDKGALRAVIDGQVEGLSVTVTGNAKQGDFNYGYYIHEHDAGGKDLRLPGAEKKFLDKAYDESKFKSIIEDELKRRFKEAGW